MFKFYLPQLIFFTVFFVSAIPILYYIQRKNPDPRFRPNFGEMSLFTVMAALLCGAMALGLGSLFKPENDGRGATKKPGFDIPSAASGDQEEEGGRKSKNKSKSSGGGDGAPRRLNDRL